MYKSNAPKSTKCNRVIVSSIVVCVCCEGLRIRLIPIAFMLIKITFMQEKKTEKKPSQRRMLSSEQRSMSIVDSLISALNHFSSHRLCNDSAMLILNVMGLISFQIQLHVRLSHWYALVGSTESERTKGAGWDESQFHKWMWMWTLAHADKMMTLHGILVKCLWVRE